MFILYNRFKLMSLKRQNVFGRWVLNLWTVLLPLGVPVLPLVYIIIAVLLPSSEPASVSRSSRLLAESPHDLLFNLLRLYTIFDLSPYTSAAQHKEQNHEDSNNQFRKWVCFISMLILELIMYFWAWFTILLRPLIGFQTLTGKHVWLMYFKWKIKML